MGRRANRLWTVTVLNHGDDGKHETITGSDKVALYALLLDLWDKEDAEMVFVHVRELLDDKEVV